MTSGMNWVKTEDDKKTPEKISICVVRYYVFLKAIKIIKSINLIFQVYLFFVFFVLKNKPYTFVKVFSFLLTRDVFLMW